MKQEIELDDSLPKPGEPLTPKIDPVNQAVLEDELEERKQRAAAKLPRRKRRKLIKRHEKLRKQLKRINWNALIVERWQLHQQHVALKYEYEQATNKRQRSATAAKAKAIGERGRTLNMQIAKYQSIADEYANVTRLLDTHREIVRFEREDAQNMQAFRREAVTWEQQIKAVFRQSKRLHHAGYDTKGRYFCDIPRIERTIFKEDRVLYLLKITKRTWLRKWKSALPYNVDVPDLVCEETLENLSAATNRIVSIVRSKSGTRLFYAISRLDSPDGIPHKVLYSKVMPWYPVQDHAKTPWCAGVSNDRKTQWFNFEDAPHILIAGSTKSGKSNHVNNMIATLVTMNSPKELGLILVDNKGGVEFTHWKELKHLVRPMIKNTSDVLPILKWLRGVMDRRLAALEAVMAKNLPSYNGKVAEDHRLPRVVMVIDEMSTLLGLGDLTTEIQNNLRVLVSQGRAVGINMVICTQTVTVDVLPSWIKDNMAMRIAGFIPGFHASMSIIGSPTASTLPQDVIGRLVFALGRQEVIAQSPLTSDDTVADAVSISKQYADVDHSEFVVKQTVTESGEIVETLPALIVPVLKFTRDDLIKLAIEKFEGKLTPSRMHEMLGNEIITLRRLRTMIDEVIHSEKIEHQGVQYGLKKMGHNYILVALPRPDNTMNQAVCSEPDVTTCSDERSDEDTEPVETMEESIEDEDVEAVA